MVDYIDHNNEIFQHFLEDKEYHILYKEVCEGCKAKFDNYIQTGSSVDYANQKVIEENKFLKAKFGLKLQHNPSKSTHKDHLYGARRVVLSRVATVVFYLSLLRYSFWFRFCFF